MLQAERQKLLDALNFFSLSGQSDAPEIFKHIDPAFARELLTGADLPWEDDGGVYPETARVCRELASRSPVAARVLLESDLEFILAVKETGADHIHAAPWGILEAAFPIRVRGRVVHCLWTGKIRSAGLPPGELAKIAGELGVSPAELEHFMAAAPPLPRSQIDRLFEMCSRLRCALEHSIAHHVRAGELTRQLVQSERTHSLGTLSGGVAHHFNNLLSIILGYASFVLNREKVSREATDALHKISEAAQRGRRLTEEVLAFLGSDEEEESVCRVHEVLISVISLLESQTGTRVRVATHLDSTRDTVLAPPGSIRQIVFNLLTNAIDSLPNGGTLTVRTANVNMEAEKGRAADFFQLEVSDTSTAKSRAPARETQRGEATGESRANLKLSSVYRIVGRLDGTVVVTTTPTGGGQVRVLLPTVAAEAEKTHEQKSRRKLAPSQVWVVDDDPIFRAMCRQVLAEEGGHAVEELAGGREMQELWRSHKSRPNLIIVDFSMPEYNGLQLCEWLKEQGSEVPVVLVSGFGPNQPDIRKALRMKKTFFLQKPFTSRDLSDTVTVALGETLIGE